MHTVVVFHERRRDRVDEALRALAEAGVGRESVVVTPTGEPPPEQGPRSVLGLPHAIHYGGVGAAIGMLAGVAMAPERPEAPTTIWLIIAGAVLGAFFGMAVGLVVGGIRRQRWRIRAPRPDLTVRVEADSPEVVERARAVLLEHGGELRAPAAV